MGKKKKKYGSRGSAEWAYINFHRRFHRRNYSICESIGYSDSKQGTSLYGDFNLNPSVIPSAFQTVNRSRHRMELSF
jgi:hypothetical protein